MRRGVALLHARHPPGTRGEEMGTNLLLTKRSRHKFLDPKLNPCKSNPRCFTKHMQTQKWCPCQGVQAVTMHRIATSVQGL